MRPRRARAMPRAMPASRSASRTRARPSASSERRARTSSNGRSARDSRLDSIGAPTVAPCVVMEPWSKAPSTRPVSWSAQTTTGTPGSASRAAIVQAAGHRHRLDDEDRRRRRRSANLRPTAAPVLGRGDLDDRDRLDASSASSSATARASASRSARNVGPAVCSQSVQYGWTTPTRGRGAGRRHRRQSWW